MVARTIEAIGLALDVVGVAAIVVGGGTAFWLFAVKIRAGAREGAYRSLRRDIGRAILLGLEILVAADIIRTVAIQPTLESVAVLGGIVLIRTVLSFALETELEGRWPWKRQQDAATSTGVRGPG
jgi:uncharacterized membrane protein